jgi:hypothetical protein
MFDGIRCLLWYKMFDDILVGLMGFSRCPVAPCLYIRKNEHDTIIIFVDDGSVSCTSEDLIDTFMTEIHKHLPKVTVVKHIHKYIGIKTDYDRNGNHMRFLCDRSRWDILCATGEISTGGD